MAQKNYSNGNVTQAPRASHSMEDINVKQRGKRAMGSHRRKKSSQLCSSSNSKSQSVFAKDFKIQTKEQYQEDLRKKKQDSMTAKKALVVAGMRGGNGVHNNNNNFMSQIMENSELEYESEEESDYSSSNSNKKKKTMKDNRKLMNSHDMCAQVQSQSKDNDALLKECLDNRIRQIKQEHYI